MSPSGIKYLDIYHINASHHIINLCQVISQLPTLQRKQFTFVQLSSRLTHSNQGNILVNSFCTLSKASTNILQCISPELHAIFNMYPQESFIQLQHGFPTVKLDAPTDESKYALHFLYHSFVLILSQSYGLTPQDLSVH